MIHKCFLSVLDVICDVGKKFGIEKEDVHPSIDSFIFYVGEEFYSFLLLFVVPV